MLELERGAERNSVLGSWSRRVSLVRPDSFVVLVAPGPCLVTVNVLQLCSPPSDVARILVDLVGIYEANSRQNYQTEC